jgi:NTP pyrophosphatase (non-canonical NTP hydrolase)
VLPRLRRGQFAAAGNSGRDMDIRSGQELAWANKLAKMFNTTNIPLEFCLLQVEIAEAFHEWRKGGTNIGVELVDAAINLLGLAGMTGVDLQAEVEAKLAKKSAHIYQRQPDDVLAKSCGESG